MKWAITLSNGWNTWFWNGEGWFQDNTEAVLFHTKELAEKVMNRVFCREEPEDEDDHAFLRNLCVQTIT